MSDVLLAAALGNLLETISALGVVVPADLETVTDPVANANLLAVLREARKDLVLLEQFVERTTAERMGKASAIEWRGGRAIRRRTSTNVKWKSEEVATAVAVRAMVDENGELPSVEAQAVGSAVKAAIVKAAGFSYWRTQVLMDEMQIDPDDFRTRERGRFVVEVELGDGEEAA